MPILTLIIVILAVGLGLYAINRYLPMDGRVKNILNVVVLVALVLWLLKVFGVIEALKSITI